VPLCVNPDHLDPVTHAVNVRRGANAKLSEAAVEQVLWFLEHTSHSQREVGEQFGVSQQTVSAIAKGQRWRETVGRQY